MTTKNMIPVSVDESIDILKDQIDNLEEFETKALQVTENFDDNRATENGRKYLSKAVSITNSIQSFKNKLEKELKELKSEQI